MVGLQWKILLKWMIYGYPHFRKSPCRYKSCVKQQEVKFSSKTCAKNDREVCSGTFADVSNKGRGGVKFASRVILPGRKPLASYQLCVGNLGAQVSDADLYNAFRSLGRFAQDRMLGMNQEYMHKWI
jgi:hypothetical protein